MRVDFTFDTKMPKILTDSGRRARDLTPAITVIRRDLYEQLRGNPRTKSRHSTGRLDRSIREIEVWRQDRTTFEYGTAVPYVLPYMKWRKKRQLQQIFLLGPDTEQRMHNAILTWIRDGRPVL